MRLRVLGSSAGGGFPQWNCNCPNCDGLRRGSILARPRTQSSVALTANGVDWLLINASPEVLQQLRETPELQPARQIRDSGVAAVLLIDAQIDHCTGLLMLRERNSPLPLYATPEVLDDIGSGFPLTRLLGHYCGLDLRPIQLDGQPLAMPFLPGLELIPVPLTSQPPPYSPFRGRPRPGDNIGLLVRNLASGKSLFYAPGLGQIDDATRAVMAQADVVLVDGTFWTEDEMIRLGLSSKPAAAMGHLPQSGPGGMIEQLDALPASMAKWLIHINNTNPILREDSAERAELGAHGIQVAHDGLEIAL
ncbi:MAG: pyrroloquinoline quinone biosynthesis protein PqqB [Burkholderiales bacterium RIFOXYC12_FULL_65_23]|uniref:pyrroloquinoline quinone biosynthesis protein PqqB n=1 Tax=Malikia spinosa TaxID=86180 RepID=UPI0008B8CBE1|nr:pyrroloquinoline quinone biosynthesis protein PqqB [Malikia spinosa]OGB69996.1 MAG: pyrroloquinoline quinone biosynthesis protein PqqB [Burkholderiales bacterium RIFOXYC12_FULL_65_23]